MRRELNQLTRGVLAAVDPKSAPTPTDDEIHILVAAADVVTLARTAVKYDGRGDVIDAHAPELPTRFAKRLAQIFRGAVVIGLDRDDALRLAIRCARDSMPPLRLAIIDDLAKSPRSTPTDVRKRLKKPRSTVDRQLQALHILEVEGAFGKKQTHWYYTLADGISPTVLRPDTVTRKTTKRAFGIEEDRTGQEEDRDTSGLHNSGCFSGNGATSPDDPGADGSGTLFGPASNGATPSTPEQNANYRVGMCKDCGLKPHAPGSPRCDDCRRNHSKVIAGYDR
jgi:hypothetical protein